MVTGIVALIGVFSFLGFFVYLFFSTRHKERMALIESGKDADIFFGKSLPKHFAALKWGLLLLFVGIGGGIGIFTDVSNNHDGPIVTFPLVFAMGGLGLLVYYFLVKDKGDNEEL